MEQFENLTNIEETVEESGKTKSAEKKELNRKKKEDLLNKIKADPTYSEQVFTKQDNLEVINALAHPNVSSIVRGEDKVQEDGSTKRGIEQAIGIVGYKVKNIGDEPVKYTTCVYTKDADGKYEGKEVSRTVEPGETFDIAKKYLTIMLSYPEYSMGVKNGALRRGPATATDSESEFNAYYFKPYDDTIKVNSDEFKLNIGVKGADDVWGIKPEYEETFGFVLNTEKKKGGKRSSAGGPSVTNQQIAANYIQSLLNGDATI